MSRVVLALANAANARLLGDELASRHDIIHAEDAAALDQPFDLAIFDGPRLAAWRVALGERRRAEPCALPVLMLTTRAEVGLATAEVWQVVDDVVTVPVVRAELGARVALALRAREASLAAHRRAEGLDDFARAIAHDLRAPVRAIEGFTNALLEDFHGTMPASAIDHAKRITEAAVRLDGMIERLGVFVRLDGVTPATDAVSLKELMSEVLRRMAPVIVERSAVIKVGADLPMVRAHHEGLALVFTNLLDNATKYCRPGETPVVEVSARAQGHSVEVVVQDNGIGVPEAERERVFRLFTRLHGRERYPGMGAGLALVRAALERMGGSVRCVEGAARGARFVVTLAGGSP